MFDYAAMASAAQELVEEFGAAAILVRNADAEYDVDTGTVVGNERRWSGKAVRIEYALGDIDGGLIQFTDARLLAGTANFEPAKPGDRILFAGEWFQVVNCKPIKPATIAVAYDIQARR